MAYRLGPVVVAIALRRVGLASAQRYRLYARSASYPPGPMARILITSALPYINGIKHLGNLAGSMLPADVYARFQRARGHQVVYICATDEHGTPAELAAQAADEDVFTYCERYHRIQHDLGRRFGLSWDWFGRSSSPPSTSPRCWRTTA
jgi:methionyl-tRNA synthetase